MSEVQVTRILPMRTGEDQWRLAGPETCVGTINAATGHVYVGGKGGDAVLSKEEWKRYELLVARWKAGEVLLLDAPVISMREQTAHEDDPFPAATGKEQAPLRDADVWMILRSCADELKLVRGLITRAEQTVNVEDYGDSLAGAGKRLEQLVTTVTELRLGLIYDWQTDGLFNREVLKAQRMVDSGRIVDLIAAMGAIMEVVLEDAPASKIEDALRSIGRIDPGQTPEMIRSQNATCEWVRSGLALIKTKAWAELVTRPEGGAA